MYRDMLISKENWAKEKNLLVFQLFFFISLNPLGNKLLYIYIYLKNSRFRCIEGSFI